MDYDMTIHHNPDAQAWAKFFIETTKDMDREVFSDEGYMIAWFANAMMAMYDSMDPQKAANEIVRLRKLEARYWEFASKYDSQLIEIEQLRGQVEFASECRNGAYADVEIQNAKIERLRKILSTVLKACKDVNSPDRKVREEITRTVGKALKGKA